MVGIYLAAAHKSSGKTTLTIGLSAAFTRQGANVQTFKKGPDYIDPLWLSKASGNPCYNLDFYVDSEQEILNRFHTHAVNKDLSLIEGNKGLYDGLSLDGTDSNAALAVLLGLPVILVIDCTGITRGIAPLLLGYKEFQTPRVNFAGVILNKVAGARHEAKLVNSVEEYTDFNLLGALGKSSDLMIEERHLGLIPSNESKDVTEFIQRLATRVGQSVDLSQISTIASGVEAIVHKPPKKATVKAAKSDLTIGVAQDEAFGFYYQSDIDEFVRLGARLQYFSIVHDKALPKIDGLFLGGGFPETHMDKISANSRILNDLAKKIDQGLPVYAECGGMMILAKSLYWQGKKVPMANVIKADCVMSAKPCGRGYVRLQPTEVHPWVLTKNALEIKAHEFHYSQLEKFTADYEYAYTVVRGTGIKDQQDGLVYKNLLTNYAHLKSSTQFSWIDGFLRFCRGVKARRNSKQKP